MEWAVSYNINYFAIFLKIAHVQSATEDSTNFHSIILCFCCVWAVVTGNRHSCRDDTAMTLTSDEGFISSVIAENLGVGSMMCPWKISLNPGQRINITLYDFATPTDVELEKIGNLDSALCYQYALITERR